MTDLSITAANVLAGGNATIVHGVAGVALTAGQVVYLDKATGKWKLADSNATGAKVPGGLALHAAAVNQPIAVQTAGDIAIGAALTAGSPYYLSETPGGVQPADDLGEGESVAQLGLAKSATVLALKINVPGVTHLMASKTSAADVKKARVVIELDGEERTLIPSPDAILTLSMKYDGFSPLMASLQRLSVQAATDVVVAGLGADGKVAKELGKAVAAEGVINLLPKLIEFVMVLGNGGKPLKDAEEQEGCRPFSVTISFADYSTELIKLAMGRLFKSFDEARLMDCCAIILAIDGQDDFLKMLFGAEPDDDKLPALRPGTLR